MKRKHACGLAYLTNGLHSALKGQEELCEHGGGLWPRRQHQEEDDVQTQTVLVIPRLRYVHAILHSCGLSTRQHTMPHKLPTVHSTLSRRLQKTWLWLYVSKVDAHTTAWRPGICDGTRSARPLVFQSEQSRLSRLVTNEAIEQTDDVCRTHYKYQPEQVQMRETLHVPGMRQEVNHDPACETHQAHLERRGDRTTEPDRLKTLRTS